MTAQAAHPWPGNDRELQNVLPNLTVRANRRARAFDHFSCLLTARRFKGGPRHLQQRYSRSRHWGLRRSHSAPLAVRRIMSTGPPTLVSQVEERQQAAPLRYLSESYRLCAVSGRVCFPITGGR